MSNLIETEEPAKYPDMRLGILQADRRMALQYAVTNILAESTTLHYAIPNLLQALCVLGSWDFGEIWLIDHEKKMLVSKGSWIAPKLKGSGISSSTNKYAFSRGVDLPGRIWASSKTVWLSTLVEDPSTPYATSLAKEGMKTLFGAPIFNQYEVAGVILLSHMTVRHPEADFQELLRALGSQIGEYIRRRTAEEALEHNEKRFRALIEHSSDLKMVIATDGKILYLTPSVERMMGYRPEELTGRILFDQIHPDNKDEAKQFVSELFTRPNETLTCVYRIRSKGGPWLWFETIGTNLLSEPAVSGIVLNARNITEYKRVQEEISKLNASLEEQVGQRTAQLKAANEELEAFSYSIAHDLRAPLRALNGFTHVVLKDHSANLDSEAIRLLGIVRQNTIRMGELIDDLLSFSRISRQELGPPSKVNMNQIVHRVIEEVKRDDPALHVKFDLRDLPPARCSMPMIHQVWINLISNAIKFTRKKSDPLIEIGSIAGFDEDIYYVKDNGVGFDNRFVDKIFGMFQRLHSLKEYEGTGVGLAIVKRIVNRHSGRVWAEGILNKGATIFFSLPKIGSERN